MKNLVVIITFIIAFCLNSCAYALTEKPLAENDVLTLEDCVNIALTNSPEVKKYQGYLKASKARVGQAKAEYFPSLNAKTGYTYNGEYIHNTSSGIYSANASLSQLIYNFGRTGATINMQKFYMLSSEADLQDVILKTIFNVRQQYYAVLAASANVKIQNAYVQTNERLYQRTKAYFEEGLKSKIDVVNAEVYLSESHIAFIEAKNTYENALISLNNSMYLMDTTKYSIETTESFNFKSKTIPIELKSHKEDIEYKLPSLPKDVAYATSVEKTEILKDFIFKPFPYGFEEVIEMANKNRPDLKALRTTCLAIGQALKYAKRQFTPSINVNVGYGLQATNESNRDTSGLNAGAFLEFPILNAMDIKYRIDEAKANLDVANETLSKAEKDVFFSVQKAYIDMKKLEKQIPLQHTKVKQALENFELADGRYEVGLSDFIELQDAKVRYNSAQQEYVKIVFDYNVARAKLELAIALLPEDIKKIEGMNNNETK